MFNHSATGTAVARFLYYDTMCMLRRATVLKHVRHPSSHNAVYRSLAWVAHTCPKILSRGLRQPDIIAGKKQNKIYFSSSEYGYHSTGPVFAARVLISSARPFTSNLRLLFLFLYILPHPLSRIMSWHRSVWPSQSAFGISLIDFFKDFVDIVAINVKSNQGE